ncbi:hypothetical protein EV186_102463 [Labedaea rhizosphaerae]|uniref:Uncharacterized protein n=1 Tax=Labedaea rhizosphaerae TaxID=598644 RepID=A0A4R6SF51_LABRH|nr:hypothetical protein EV186_102463 [Labedaea rhizosphaerae]
MRRQRGKSPLAQAAPAPHDHDQRDDRIPKRRGQRRPSAGWRGRATQTARAIDDALSAGPLPQRWAAPKPRANAIAIATLTGLVAVVAALAVVFSSHTAPNLPAVTTSKALGPETMASRPTPTSTADQTHTSAITTGTDAPGTRLRTLVPDHGVRPITPKPPAKADPRSVRLAPAPTRPPTAADLATPESAARAWMARSCPFDYRRPPDAAWRAAAPALTDQERLRSDPARDPRYARSWQQIVSAQENGRCSSPTAMVSPEAPRTSDRAVVIVSASRVVTSPVHPPYVEDQFAVRIVIRGQDQLWRVDAETTGG